MTSMQHLIILQMFFLSCLQFGLEMQSPQEFLIKHLRLKETMSKRLPTHGGVPAKGLDKALTLVEILLISMMNNYHAHS